MVKAEKLCNIVSLIFQLLWIITVTVSCNKHLGSYLTDVQHQGELLKIYMTDITNSTIIRDANYSSVRPYWVLSTAYDRTF